MELIVVCTTNAERVSDDDDRMLVRLPLLIEAADASVGDDMHRSIPDSREVAMTAVGGRDDATMVDQ